MTLEGAGGSRIVVPGKPFVVTTLILDVVVGRALLGSEVLGIRRAVMVAACLVSNILSFAVPRGEKKKREKEMIS